MKLFNIYNRVNLITIIIIILITGIAYYFVISAILIHQVDKDLVEEEGEVFEYVNLNHRLPPTSHSEDQLVYFKQVASPANTREFINSSFWSDKEKEAEQGRELITSVSVNNKNYQVHIIESRVETEYLIQVIFLITLVLVVLLVLALYVINRLLIKKLWRPFYNTMHALRQFNLTDKDNIILSTSGIDEFKELNDTVNLMASRVKDDYKSLKHFIENASHELLTPIAVINSKLDLLIQSGDFNRRQSELLSDVYQTVAKLTRLNKAMLLLSKIENKLIIDNAPVNLKTQIEELLNQFHELFINKAITVTADMKAVTVLLSRSLFEVLMNNLLSNAIRHNIYEGQIFISLTDTELTIKNTGEGNALDDKQMFQRFNKSAISEGNGLGLTISQQICANYNMELRYSYENSLHVFTVIFNH